MPELGTLGSVRGALSNERPYRDKNRCIPGADAGYNRKATWTGALMRAPARARRGLRPWHVWKLFAREPGDLGLAIGRNGRHGPHREGEEP